MELNYHNILLKGSKITTVSSYLKGTFIFTWFTVSNQRNEILFIVGFFFVLSAVIVNLIVFVASAFVVINTKEIKLKKEFKQAMFLQLMNIPIAVAYFYYIMHFGDL